jgi:hypothetical protein
MVPALLSEIDQRLEDNATHCGPIHTGADYPLRVSRIALWRLVVGTNGRPMGREKDINVDIAPSGV